MKAMIDISYNSYHRFRNSRTYTYTHDYSSGSQYQVANPPRGSEDCEMSSGNILLLQRNILTLADLHQYRMTV